MTPDLKKLLNKIKCPICKSPVDILHRSSGYFCASNTDHYHVFVMNEINGPEIYKETVSIYDDEHKYLIVKAHDVSGTVTEIYTYDVDAEGRVQFTFKSNIMVFERDVFDFNNFDTKKAITRIKTLTIFK